MFSVSPKSKQKTLKQDQHDFFQDEQNSNLTEILPGLSIV